MCLGAQVWDLFLFLFVNQLPIYEQHESIIIIVIIDKSIFNKDITVFLLYPDVGCTQVILINYSNSLTI